jgi:hypothetical protein
MNPTSVNKNEPKMVKREVISISLSRVEWLNQEGGKWFGGHGVRLGCLARAKVIGTKSCLARVAFRNGQHSKVSESESAVLWNSETFAKPQRLTT